MAAHRDIHLQQKGRRIETSFQVAVVLSTNWLVQNSTQVHFGVVENILHQQHFAFPSLPAINTEEEIDDTNAWEGNRCPFDVVDRAMCCLVSGRNLMPAVATSTVAFQAHVATAFHVEDMLHAHAQIDVKCQIRNLSSQRG